MTKQEHGKPGGTPRPDRPPNPPRRHPRSNLSPIVAGSLFEGFLGVLAIALALLFGLRPWTELELSPFALLFSVAATTPLLALLALFRTSRWQWAVRLQELVRHGLLPWLRDAGPAGFAVLAILAGVGEELLFRGVIQAGLTGWLGPWGALVVASVLFGLAHALSRAYFVIATLVGAYLGLIYLWTGNLLIPILIHALYDWLALLYYRRMR